MEKLEQKTADMCICKLCEQPIISINKQKNFHNECFRIHDNKRRRNIYRLKNNTINIRVDDNGNKLNVKFILSNKLLNHLKILNNNQFGSKHPKWKGDNVKYSALHSWVKRNKPKPKSCENCEKILPLDLANISGEYKRDFNDFKWLCRSCHFRLDKRIRKNKREDFVKEVNKNVDKEKAREYRRLYNLRNRDRRKILDKIYQEENKFIIKERRHNYYLENKDKICKKNKEYYKNNLDKIKKTHYEYRLKKRRKI